MPNWINVQVGFEDPSDMKRKQYWSKLAELIEVLDMPSSIASPKMIKKIWYKELVEIAQKQNYFNKIYNEICSLLDKEWNIINLHHKHNIKILNANIEELLVCYYNLHEEYVSQLRDEWGVENHTHADEIMSPSNIYMLEILIRLAKMSINNHSEFSKLRHFSKEIKNTDWLLLQIRYFYNKVVRKTEINNNETQESLFSRAESIYNQLRKAQNNLSHIPDIQDKTSEYLWRRRKKHNK